MKTLDQVKNGNKLGLRLLRSLTDQLREPQRERDSRVSVGFTTPNY